MHYTGELLKFNCSDGVQGHFYTLSQIHILDLLMDWKTSSLGLVLYSGLSCIFYQTGRVEMDPFCPPSVAVACKHLGSSACVMNCNRGGPSSYPFVLYLLLCASTQSRSAS